MRLVLDDGPGRMSGFGAGGGSGTRAGWQGRKQAVHSKRARRSHKMHDGALHQGRNHSSANEAITDLNGFVGGVDAMTGLLFRNDTPPNGRTGVDILIQAGRVAAI